MSKAMKGEKKGLVPRLRFPEFRDAEEWELKKLGDEDVAEFVKKRVSRDQLVIDTYVSTENILPDFGGITTASKLPPSGSFTSYKKGDILIANIRPYLKKVWVAKRNGGASNDVVVVRPKEKNDNALLQFILRNEVFIDYVMTGAKGVKMPRGDVALMKEYPLALPSPEEQQKIADCLSSLDALIAAQAEKIDALKTHKKGLMQRLFPREGETVPRLRFPEFRDKGEWNSDPVKGLVTTVTPPKKLTSDQYEDEGRFPVIDQSQEYICGWTNDEHALVSVESPLIIFGDHTCALKIVDQPFVQGADGIKILKSKNVIEPGFLYQYLLFSPVKMESYKRHFSTLKEKLVVYPEKKTGEQQKIADCLSSLDALIAANTEKLEALKSHKKGLMQQLFPSPEAVGA